MPNPPTFIFYEKRMFCDPLVELAIQAVGDFHDAALDYCNLFNGGIRFRFWKSYFGELRKYDQFGVKGAEIVLFFDPQPDPTNLMLIYGLFDRSVYNFGVNFITEKININATDIYDLDVRFRAASSTFEWLFQPLDAKSMLCGNSY